MMQTTSAAITGIDMHDGTAGKIKHSPAGKKAAAPGHMPDRYIAEGEPDNHENQHGAELHTLGKGSNDECRGDDRKGHLEGQEDRLGYGATEGVNRQILEEELGGVSHYCVAIGDGIAVAVDDPEQGHDAGHCKALTEDREDVLCPHQAAIEQCQTRKGHEEHQRRGDDHPGGVSAIERCCFLGPSRRGCTEHAE